jgi:soluble lytic murein transglycosylase-like protein
MAALLTVGALPSRAAQSVSAAAPGDTPDVCATAELHNGNLLEYTRREAVGAATRLWLCADAGAGYVEIPTRQIVRFYPAEAPVPPTPARTAPATPPVPSPPADGLKGLIARAAAKNQIDPDFITSVIKAESGFNPLAVSPKGAQGLMQLMPGTAARLGVTDALDPAANVAGGALYLRKLFDLYRGDALKTLGAYNAGPQRVEQYGGVPPYPETRAFITRVVEDYNRQKQDRQASSPANP